MIGDREIKHRHPLPSKASNTVLWFYGKVHAHFLSFTHGENCLKSASLLDSKLAYAHLLRAYTYSLWVRVGVASAFRVKNDACSGTISNHLAEWQKACQDGSLVVTLACDGAGWRERAPARGVRVEVYSPMACPTKVMHHRI